MKTNEIKCNNSERHSQLVAGKTFECEKGVNNLIDKGMSERFDEKFDGLWVDGMFDYKTDTVYGVRETKEKLKYFIQSEIDMAKAERDRELVEILDKRCEKYMKDESLSTQTKVALIREYEHLQDLI